MDFSIVVIIIQLIFLECILSIDNAAVLGAMVIPLPSDEGIPWPRGMIKFGHAMDKIMGPQRTAALRVGLIGAYAGQSLMLLLATYIIANPWLKIVGAAYLIHLALDNLSANGYSGGEDEETVNPVKVRSFWMTVVTVELMDLAFSLDNVVAAVAISKKLWVVMLGVAIAIVIIRFAAGWFSYIIEKEPILKSAAYILILNIGIELILDEVFHITLTDWTKFGISVVTLLLALAYGHIRFLQFFRPVLIWISQLFAIVNMLITWVFAPIKGLFNLIMGWIKGTKKTELQE
jgi:tellurite resistance protein TerC